MKVVGGGPAFAIVSHFSEIVQMQMRVTGTAATAVVAAAHLIGGRRRWDGVAEMKSVHQECEEHVEGLISAVDAMMEKKKILLRIKREEMRKVLNEENDCHLIIVVAMVEPVQVEDIAAVVTESEASVTTAVLVIPLNKWYCR